jgi:hypothetical protein
VLKTRYEAAFSPAATHARKPGRFLEHTTTLPAPRNFKTRPSPLFALFTKPDKKPLFAVVVLNS